MVRADACGTCSHYRVGANALAGYVSCDRGAMDIELECRAWDEQDRPRTLQRLDHNHNLRAVWVRFDASLSCGGWDGWQPEAVSKRVRLKRAVWAAIKRQQRARRKAASRAGHSEG